MGLGVAELITVTENTRKSNYTLCNLEVSELRRESAHQLIFHSSM
ncbi:hypothetical protein PHET_07396 [Paragonimus heterotremus]|uniref:Uncharacterized protein n=1 Tax=Paragonimus heterotremus TaxID=100268 RepID=A0A8J4WPW2_9TREM|nr:hypothetical protein PHET_07396 [Paragonimus heterotremus]